MFRLVKKIKQFFFKKRKITQKKFKTIPQQQINKLTLTKQLTCSTFLYIRENNMVCNF